MNRYAKAVVAAVGAGASAFYAANADSVMSQNDWITVAVAVITVGTATWGVQNAPAKEGNDAS
jgi:hypothetical protein